MSAGMHARARRRLVGWPVILGAVVALAAAPGARGSGGGASVQGSDVATAEFRKGAVSIGAGIVAPVPTLMPRPTYTSQAMRAKIAGQVALEVVVLEDGTVGRARLLKGLDSYYGLDAQAQVAALNWRFRPATRNGEPVAVVVTLDMSFDLR